MAIQENTKNKQIKPKNKIKVARNSSKTYSIEKIVTSGGVDPEALTVFLASLDESQKQQEIVTFAVRCTLRVFPCCVSALGQSEVVSEKHVIAVWRLLWIAYRAAIGRNVDMEVLTDAAASVVSYASETAAYASETAESRATATRNMASLAAAYAYVASAAYATANAVIYESDVAAYASTAASDAFQADRKLYPFMRHDLSVMSSGGVLTSLSLWTDDWRSAAVWDGEQAYKQLAQIDRGMADDFWSLLDGNWQEIEPWDKYERLWESYKEPGINTPLGKNQIKWEAALPNNSLLDDRPSKQDNLNRKPIAQALANWLSNSKSNRHWAIGLFGDWGVGKSTFVELLKKELKIVEEPGQHLSYEKRKAFLRNDFIYAEFNAWRYESTVNIQAGLAQEMVNGLLKGLWFFDRWLVAIKFAWRRKRLSFLWVGLPLLVALISFVLPENFFSLNDITPTDVGIGASIAALIPIFNAFKEAWKNPLSVKLKSQISLPDFNESIGAIPEMREQIKELVDIRCNFFPRSSYMKKSQRVLLVVDDLDRCSPDAVVQTLEAIRLVMDLESVIVVIAIDQRIALASLAKHYKELSEHHTTDPMGIARDYIGKVVNVPILLEDPSAKEVEKFLREKLWRDTIFGGKEMGKGSGRENRNAVPQQPEGKSRLEGDYEVSTKKNVIDLPAEEKSTGEMLSDSQVSLEKKPADFFGELESPDLVRGLNEEQQDQFIYWAGRFQLANPRHIKRLDNAYTLLRHSFKSEDQNGPPYRGLALLLWIEYINELPIAQREEVQRQARIASREKQNDLSLWLNLADDKSNVLDTELYENWKELVSYLNFPTSTSEEKYSPDVAFSTYFQQARVFALPAVEKELAMQITGLPSDPQTTP